MLLVCLMCIVIPSHAIEGKKHVIQFKKEEFNFKSNTKGQLIINCSNLATEYDSDVSSPGLPKYIVKLAIPCDKAYKNMDVVSEESLLMENVEIAPNPELRKTDATFSVANCANEKQEKYKEGIYPANNVEFICSTKVGDYTILNFKVCPFVYDTESKRLFLLNSVLINIHLQEDHDNRKRLDVVGNDYVKATVDNPEDVHLTPSLANTIYRNNTDVDYLIITRNSLVKSFMPLVNWKKKKGVRAKIETIESIGNNYYGNDIYHKIKKCIRYYCDNNRLKYVLLGCDNAVKTIGVGINTNGDVDMPTDLFYACLNGNLLWDQNGNGIPGELEDNVDMVPSVYLTRVPVRTPDDVNAFVKKLLRYEMTPTLNGWNNNLLMCGAQLDDTTSAETQSDLLYNQHIRDVWNGSRTKLFDDHFVSESLEDANYCINAENLQSQLEQGYTFIDVNTHGEPIYWQFGENTNNIYDRSCAANLQSTQPSVILTSACLTNAFDKSNDPCLSEAFIRNPNNSFIAYLGCSREGWYSSEHSLTGSMMYNAMFYKYLFSTEQTNKSYGAIVARAKMENISRSNSYNEYRWIQFGLNPIGDPEMPMFYNTPIEFNTVSYTKTGENSISVCTGGVSDCRICVMSSEDWGDTYYQIVDSTSNALFTDLPANYSICVTKQGYIPYILEHRNYIQNQTINDSMNIVSSNLRVGKSVTTEKPVGEVVFENGIININGSNVRLESGTTVRKGVLLNINSQ